MTRAERRTFPRIDVEHRLRAEAVSLGCLEVRIIDLSLGGFLIESPIAFEPGIVEHDFRLVSLGGRRATCIRAKCVHCARSTTSEEVPTYTCGFAFADASAPETQANINALLEEAMAVLQFSGFSLRR